MFDTAILNIKKKLKLYNDTMFNSLDKEFSYLESKGYVLKEIFDELDEKELLLIKSCIRLKED